MPRTEGRSDSESLKVLFLGATDKAWKVAAVGKREECWVPISQCELVPANPNEGDECWLMIPQWLLRQKPELT
jgi:hypothetical protein